MAGQVIEIFFLGEDVVLRGFFATGKTPENNGAIDLCGELSAALRVDAIGFAVAAFLSAGQGSGAIESEANQSRQKGRYEKCAALPCAATMHLQTWCHETLPEGS